LNQVILPKLLERLEGLRKLNGQQNQDKMNKAQQIQFAKRQKEISELEKKISDFEHILN